LAHLGDETATGLADTADMEIASQQINIEAARLLFSPALIAASVAVWLLLTSGAAGHIVLRVEEISAGLRVPSQRPLPTSAATPVEQRQLEAPTPTCTRPEIHPGLAYGGSGVADEAEESRVLASLAPYFRVDSHAFDLRRFRPSTSQRDGIADVPKRRQQHAREPAIATKAPPALLRAVTER